MLNITLGSFAAGLTLAVLSAAPAAAQASVTFVSGKGTDAGNCPATTPCRTFQYALSRTFAGGEIKALDPASYNQLTINKSISITGVDGAGVVRSTAGAAVTINAGAAGVVSLSNLTIDGFNKTATTGISLNSAATVTIRNCTVRNFSDRGIYLRPSTTLRFLLADVAVTDNNSNGVDISPFGTASGVLDHVLAARNAGTGIWLAASLAGPLDVSANDSVASENSSTGFLVGVGATTLRLNHSTITKNSVGIAIGGTARSAGNNFINGNSSTNVSGTLAIDGTL